MSEETCTDDFHLQIVKDKFCELPGVKRACPGDCYCKACGSALPLWWNSGRPVPVESRT